MKRTFLAFLLGALIVGAGAVAYRFVFTGTSDTPQWILASLSGDVQVSLHGEPWQPAEIKMRLQGHDRIKCADDGEAMLVHDESHVMVRPRSNVEVTLLTEDSSRFQIGEGVVDVEARGDDISMRSTAGAQIDAKDAGFAVSVRPDGWTQVLGKRGEVDFSSVGRTEKVHEGEMAEAAPGQAPSAPVPIPDVLLLNVSFPDAASFRTHLATVSGKTNPGQRIQIAGKHVEVGNDGTWTADLELAEGMNQIEVTASDAMGRTRVEKSGPIRVDTQAPTLSGAAIGGRAVGEGG